MLQRLTIKHCHKLAEQKNGKCLSTEYVNNKIKYLWECKKKHQWWAKYNDIQQKQWCPKCAKEKKKQTNLKKFGVSNPFQSERIKEKIKQTMLKKYGVENPQQNKKIQEKTRKTLLKKYGVENPQQNKKIALKTVKSSNNSYIFHHWKTNQELVCIGSYEKLVVEYLNQNKINFEWQSKIFKTPFFTPTGLQSTYRPDVYLVKENLWIEIKGYFRDNAEKKWNWFHKEYPNSELWDKIKLKEMRIL